ncbi:hypothetical protein [Butyrivibrio sp. AE3004]|uniref:hypothetical protein n=1 Tax=Butyrivibrio sp. AE3004 TaxID=1506994 RepID=UPI00049442CC|nr:hypothetical protein [Butyrivibrio sp. AE3004]
MIKDVGKPSLTAMEENHPEEYIREKIGLIVFCNYGRVPFERSVMLSDVLSLEYKADYSDKAFSAAINMIRTEMGNIEAIGIKDNLYFCNENFWTTRGYTKERYLMNGSFCHICIFDDADREAFFEAYD